ncbi:MAG: metal-dependent transcriptional regulator [Methanomicrobiales archaeon]|nr:metal-dependent transcriptional regulator [Methanomicrobiales archaeon]
MNQYDLYDTMREFSGCEISPRRSEYLSYILEKGGSIKPKDLADHFQVDPSTITKAVGRLADSGLVYHTPYQGISLTDSGRQYAEFLVRRHRILGLILCKYGLSREEACRQALQMEGSLPRTFVDKMCASLGHPRKGICGDIPYDISCCSRETRPGERERE